MVDEQCNAFATYYDEQCNAFAEDLSVPREEDFEKSYLHSTCVQLDREIKQYLKEVNINEIMFTVSEIVGRTGIEHREKSPEEILIVCRTFEIW